MKTNSCFLYAAMLVLTTMGTFQSYAQSKAPINNTATSTAKKTAFENYKYEHERGEDVTSISIDVPVGDTPITKIIRDDLWKKMKEIVKGDIYDLSYDESFVPPYQGTEGDFQALCDHHGKALDKRLNTSSVKEEWDHFSIYTKLELKRETSRYIVFWQSGDGYTGGAHGLAWGKGGITYDLRTGKEIKKFIKSGVTGAMQPLLKRYLKTYFQEGSKPMTDRELYENLQIEGRIIPLPAAYNVFPDKNGLTFTYAHYEIACYAAGMPEFTIPYSLVKPYLTPEAKALLGL